MVTGKFRFLIILIAAITVVLYPVNDINVSAKESKTVKVYLGGYPVNIELYTESGVISSLGDMDIPAASDEQVISKSGVSGLGTVTFERFDGTYRALGHAVASDKGECLSDVYGYVYDSEIIGAKLPSAGTAGRLIGRRAGRDPIGNIISNDTFGIEGQMFSPHCGDVCEVLSHNSVKVGKAFICTTVKEQREFYEIEIIKVSKRTSPGEKSMVIRITDSELLKKTGGILRGMSGSPILQDGKLAGAVTHVFTEDPTRGYGIYAEWML